MKSYTIPTNMHLPTSIIPQFSALHSAFHVHVQCARNIII